MCFFGFVQGFLGDLWGFDLGIGHVFTTVSGILLIGRPHCQVKIKWSAFFLANEALLAMDMCFEMVDDKTEELPGDKFAGIEFPLCGSAQPDEKKEKAQKERL